MAYVTSNSPYAMFANIGDQAPTNNMWRYNANSGESISDVRGSGFFTNAGVPTSENNTNGSIGMQVGDIVMVYLTTGAAYWNVVSAISTSTGAGTIVAFS